ncbi:MAG: hypothetical protein HQL25_04010 [Candidatus Omnitrophica bacterium]|nr:hypothetical protein [Candidatus Omnitrophota bacterium]
MAQNKSGGNWFVSLLVAAAIFTGGFYLGVYREPVSAKAKEIVPPLVKKAEMKIKGMFGIK